LAAPLHAAGPRPARRPRRRRSLPGGRRMLRPWLAPIFRSVWSAGWSARRVVPGVPVGQQPVRFLGAPAALGVGVDRHGVAEYRVHDPPGGLDGVLPGELPALPLQPRAVQPVVRALLAARVLLEHL